MAGVRDRPRKTTSSSSSFYQSGRRRPSSELPVLTRASHKLGEPSGVRPQRRRDSGLQMPYPGPLPSHPSNLGEVGSRGKVGRPGGPFVGPVCYLCRGSGSLVRVYLQRSRRVGRTRDGRGLRGRVTEPVGVLTRPSRTISTDLRRQPETPSVGHPPVTDEPQMRGILRGDVDLLLILFLSSL